MEQFANLTANHFKRAAQNFAVKKLTVNVHAALVASRVVHFTGAKMGSSSPSGETGANRCGHNLTQPEQSTKTVENQQCVAGEAVPLRPIGVTVGI